jgi:RNA polymerase sigma-70 factor, ECF subfamily
LDEKMNAVKLSPLQNTERLREAASWLQRLRGVSESKQLIEEWIAWSADPANLTAFEKLSVVAQAAATEQFLALPSKLRSISLVDSAQLLGESQVTPPSRGARGDLTTPDSRGNAAKRSELQTGTTQRSVTMYVVDPGLAAVDAPTVRTPSKLSQAEVAALIERNYTGLRLLVSRRCRDPNVAADLLNEAVLTTWAKWQAGKIEHPEQIAGYVLQVTMNLLRNHRRAISGGPETRVDAAEVQSLASDTEPDNETIEREIELQIKNVIRGLTCQQDRAVLERFYLEEESKDVICKDLGLNELQFDKALHRARCRLRKLLEAGGLGRSDLL